MPALRRKLTALSLAGSLVVLGAACDAEDDAVPGDAGVEADNGQEGGEGGGGGGY